MSTLFERFAKMAKEEFNCTIVKTPHHSNTTFESLFGTSVDNIALYKLPYIVSIEQYVYHEESTKQSMSDSIVHMNNFNTEEHCNFAA